MIEIIIPAVYALGIPVAIRRSWILEQKAILRKSTPGRQSRHHWYECKLGHAGNARGFRWIGVQDPRVESTYRSNGEVRNRLYRADQCNCAWIFVWQSNGMIRRFWPVTFWPLQLLRFVPIRFTLRLLRFAIVRPWRALTHPEVRIPDWEVVSSIEKEIGWK